MGGTLRSKKTEVSDWVSLFSYIYYYMKFEINSNKLEQVIFKYLDNKKFIIKETDDNYYFLDNEGDTYARIRIRKSDMYCFIHYELTEEIKTFFSIEIIDVKGFLKRYVENTLNIRVSNIERGFTKTFPSRKLKTP